MCCRAAVGRASTDWYLPLKAALSTLKLSHDSRKSSFFLHLRRPPLTKRRWRVGKKWTKKKLVWPVSFLFFLSVSIPLIYPSLLLYNNLLRGEDVYNLLTGSIDSKCVCVFSLFSSTLVSFIICYCIVSYKSKARDQRLVTYCEATSSTNDNVINKLRDG